MTAYERFQLLFDHRADLEFNYDDEHDDAYNLLNDPDELVLCVCCEELI